MLATRAFLSLNLRWNPFSETPLEERADLAVDIPEFLLEPRSAILFLGQKGRGKTTHLLAIQQQYSDSPYIHLPEFGKQPRIPQAKIIFLDEAQRLPRLMRPLIWQRAQTWVIASHHNHTQELEQAGFRVQLIHLTGLSLEKLQALIAKRLEWARRSNGEIPTVPKARLEQLLEIYGDDLRGIETELYTDYQEMQRRNP